MLLPPRYWAALAIGEMLPMAYSSLDCFDQYGPAWAVFNLFPPIAVAMPIVAWFRRHVSQVPPKRLTNISALLLCALIVAAATAWLNVGGVLTMRLPKGYVLPPVLSLAMEYFLGAYLGTLMLLPPVLMVREARRPKTLRDLTAGLANSRLAWDVVCLLLPVLLLLIWLSLHSTGDNRQIARIAMFLPVAWLTLRHGWHGAGIGGALASVAMMGTVTVLSDPAVLQVQAFLGFVVSTLLILGAHIALLHDREQRQRISGQRALALAQQGLYRAELRSRQASHALERFGGSLHHLHSNLLTQIRRLSPALDQGPYHRQAVDAHQQVYRLADRMYPRVWRERGLPAALQTGVIASCLDEAGVDYRCDIQGRGLSRLAPEVNATLYRLACDTIAYLGATQFGLSALRLVLRGGETNGRRWVVLRVIASCGIPAADASQASFNPELLAVNLGSSAMDPDAMRHLAHLYNGEMHAKAITMGYGISYLIHDPMAADIAKTVIGR